MADFELEVEIDSTLNNVFERSASAPSSPTEGATTILGAIGNIGSRGKGRRVTFPDDDTIVTGYFEAPDPWSEDYKVTTDNIVAAYRAACWKQGVKPLLRVLQQLQVIQASENRDIELSLKGEHLDSQHCEALEEVFKRLQFRILELEACHLDDEGAAAIFDMIEYYDSTTHLNISFNKSIGNQGWQACSKMLKKTPCLQYLDARNTAQNEQSLLILGRAFRTGSNLVVLHLENCGLFGRPLVILVAALKLNTTLLELYLAENKISSADGLQLGNLLRANTTLEVLDLRSNNLQDLGVCHVVDGLCQQTSNIGSGLKTLVLWNNHLTYNGMPHINRALLVCLSLATLNIGQNNICNEGIHQLKQGLLNNQTLQQLGLQNTKITCEGAVALAEYIADNQHITRLDLRENNIKVAGLMALALSMKHNHSMTCLDLDQTIKKDPYAPDGVHNHQRLLQEIQTYCNRNKSENEDENEKNANLSIQNYMPTIMHNEADLCTVFRERNVPVHRTQSVTNSHHSSVGMVSSASFPAGSKSSQYISSSLPKTRFQVCRVFLDGDNKTSTHRHSSDVSVTATYEQGFSNSGEDNYGEGLQMHSIEEPVFFHSSTRESSGESVVTTLVETSSITEERATDKTAYNSSLNAQKVTPVSGEYIQSDKSKGPDNHFGSEVAKDSVLSESTSQMLSGHSLSSETTDECKIAKESESNKHMEDGFANKMQDRNGSYRVNDQETPSHGTSGKGQTLSHRRGKSPKKISFLLPDDAETTSSPGMRKDRRMSTPAITSTRLVTHQAQSLNLKLGRQLESLDLRSSVPLSPTRLREGLLFPEPFDLKLPPAQDHSSSSPPFNTGV